MLGIRDQLDGHDLPGDDGEVEDDADLAALGPHHSRDAVDERRAGAHRAPGERTRDRRRASHLAVRAPQHDVGVEHGQQRLEVTPAGSGQEGADDLPPPGGLGFGDRVGLLHPAPGPAGQLAGGRGGALHDGRDLVKGHGEQVVQHEREPFGRGQSVQHHEQGQADRVRQHRLVLRVCPGFTRLIDGRRVLGLHRLFPSRHARVQHVQ